MQGFVVGIDQPTKYDGTLKSIIGLMDLVPVVNTELLQLSRWMADQTYAFWISCLYTMLPNALKAKSHRVVRIVDEVDEQTALDLFKELMSWILNGIKMIRKSSASCSN